LSQAPPVRRRLGRVEILVVERDDDIDEAELQVLRRVQGDGLGRFAGETLFAQAAAHHGDVPLGWHLDHTSSPANAAKTRLVQRRGENFSARPTARSRRTRSWRA